MKLKVFHNNDWREYPAKVLAEYTHEWLGERHASESVRLDGGGNEVARNLITTPYQNVTSDQYKVVEVPFGDDPPQDGETVTLLVKGELGEGKVAFYAYNSGGSQSLQSLHLFRSTLGDDGIYRTTGEWLTGATSNTHLNLYAAQSSVVAESTIESVMLVRGEYDGPYFDGSTEPTRVWVDFKLRNISGIKRIWRQADAPPPGTHYDWLGERHESASIKLDINDKEVARNYVTSSRYVAPFGYSSNSGGAVMPLTSGYENGVFYLSGYHVDQPEHFYISTYVGPFWGNATLEVADDFYPLPEVYTQSVEVMSEYQIEVRQGSGEYTTLSPGEWTTLTIAREPSSRPIGILTRNPVEMDAPAPASARLYMRHWLIEKGEYDGPFFDGDTPSDRANDLWYNTDGVPHEWVNGQGWVPIN